jgi:membrane protease YdiL (CAAX protease family)
LAAGAALQQLVFLAVVLRWGGRYPPAVPLPRLKLVHFEVVTVFLLAFLANAWRVTTNAPGALESDRLLAMSVSLGTTLVIPLLLQVLVRRRPLRELGIAPVANWRAGLVLLVWIGVYVVAALLYRPRAGLPMNVHPERVVSIGLGLFGEELLFRGFVQTRLESAHGLPAAWILSSAFFGLVHLAMVFPLGLAGLLAPLQTFAIGLLFGAVFAKTRSLFLVWPVHAVYDLVPGGLLFGP